MLASRGFVAGPADLPNQQLPIIPSLTPEMYMSLLFSGSNSHIRPVIVVTVCFWF
jgi:hypothetical protein